MKLSDLAKKAAALPDLNFDWAGPEQWHDGVFAKEVTTLPEAIKYIDALRKRMGEMSDGIFELRKAYEKMRDLMLDAEVGP